MYCGVEKHECGMYVMARKGMKRSPACMCMKLACIIGMYWHESSIGMNMACINGMNWHETHSGVLGIGVGGTGGMNMG